MMIYFGDFEKHSSPNLPPGRIYAKEQRILFVTIYICFRYDEIKKYSRQLVCHEMSKMQKRKDVYQQEYISFKGHDENA